jgi:hypothetical protein
MWVVSVVSFSSFYLNFRRGDFQYHFTKLKADEIWNNTKVSQDFTSIKDPTRLIMMV